MPRRRTLAPVVAALVLAACAGPNSTKSSTSPPPSTIAVAPSNATTAPTPSTRAKQTPAPDPYAGVTVVDVEAKSALLLGREVGYLGVTTRFVWAATSQGLVRLDPTTLATKNVDDVGRFGLAATADAVWVSDFDDDVVSRFDPTKAAQTASVQLSNNPNAIAILGDAVWVAQHRGGSVSRLDGRSGKLTAEIDVGPEGAAGPQGVAVDKTAAWVGIPNTQSIVRIDPATNAVVANITTTTSPCGGLALAADAVWVSSCFDDHFAIRIDPRTNSLVAEIDVGGFNGGPVLVDGYPWFPVNNQLVRIDSATNHIDRIVRFAKSSEFAAFGATVGFDSVYVGGQGRIARIPIAALKD